MLASRILGMFSTKTYHPITKMLYAMMTNGLRPYMSLSFPY